jgi:NAD+ synthase (glutamine-hydrolysing)
MRIAIAQMDTVVGDFDATVARMAAQAESAQGQGAGLVVFPLQALSGGSFGGLAVIDDFAADFVAALGRLADSLPIPALVPVALGEDAGSCIVVLMRDGRVEPLGVMSAGEGGQGDALDPAQGAGAAGMAGPGEAVPGFVLDGLSFVVVFDEEGLDRLVQDGNAADVIVYASRDWYDTNDEATTLACGIGGGCFVREASAADAWLVAACGVGAYDEQVFCGGSFVMAPWGELAAVAPSFEEALVVADVDPLDEGPLDRPVAVPAYQRIPYLWEALVLGTRGFFAKEGISHAGIALAGDLCSSVAAAVLVDALGPTRVHAVIAAEDAPAIADARELARNLRVDAFEPARLARDGGTAAVADLAMAELSARSREGGWGIVSPADKTGGCLEPQAFVGPFAWAPLGDVYRTDVAALARFRQTRSPVIPRGALSRLGLPRLRHAAQAGASEEAQLNAIDAMLLMSVERRMGATAIADGQPWAGLVEEVLGRLSQHEAYRRVLPSAPFVSSRAISDLDIPAGVAWRDHVRDEQAPVPGAFGAPMASGSPAGRARDKADATEGASVSDDVMERLLGELDALYPDLDWLQDGEKDPSEGGGEDGAFGSGLFSEN